jgi:hypothetical protein
MTLFCCPESRGPHGAIIDQAVFPCPEDKERWRFNRAVRLTTCAHCFKVLRGIDVAFDDGAAKRSESVAVPGIS